MRWPMVEGQVLHRDEDGLVLEDPVVLPDGQHARRLRLLSARPEHQVAVLPLLADSVVLTERFQHATRTWHWEILRAAGTEGLADTDNAARQLQDQLSASASELVGLGQVHPDPRVLADPVLLYAGRIDTVGEVAAAHGIRRVCTVPFAEAEEMALTGLINACHRRSPRPPRPRVTHLPLPIPAGLSSHRAGHSLKQIPSRPVRHRLQSSTVGLERTSPQRRRGTHPGPARDPHPAHPHRRTPRQDPRPRTRPASRGSAADRHREHHPQATGTTAHPEQTARRSAPGQARPTNAPRTSKPSSPCTSLPRIRQPRETSYAICTLHARAAAPGRSPQVQRMQMADSCSTRSGERSSARRTKAAHRVGRLHHEVAVRRASFLHQLTKRPPATRSSPWRTSTSPG